MVVFDEEKQKKRIAEIRHKEEEALVQGLAQKAGVTYIDLSGIGIDTDALRLIPEGEARQQEIAAFKVIGKQLHVAARSPRRKETLAIIQRLLNKGYDITVYMVSQKSLEKAWARYDDISMASSTRGSFLDISQESLENIAERVKTNEDVQQLFKSARGDETAHKVSRLMEIIFGSGIATGSSDIHIEPQDEQVRLRFRQDGVLHDILTFDHDTYRMLNSRIKLLSELKLTQTEDAQDGRFTINYQNKEIEIRTSVIPGNYGESIVMRILNPDGINVGLDKLGIEPRLLAILKEEISKPNGLILTTGPTGSGKTTTLYSFLNYIYDPEIKIITIEDPIEYHLEGITQTQVEHDKGYDFLSGLRAALRQDPDVVMVGEIRDKETANVAVNAALTGHLVLSTLHTNNAAGAIPRLLDLGVNPGIMAAALSTSIAQRLVRKLCPSCKKERPATADESKLMKEILEMAVSQGKNIAGYGIDLNSDLSVWEPVGCDQCGGVGYKGRIGVFEAIQNDPEIQKILEHDPSEREVKIKSAHQKILTMKEDGVIKILGGVTSIEEVEKVVDLHEDLDLFTRDVEATPDKKIKKSAKKHTKVTATETEPGPATNNPMSVRGSEVALLVDYLKMLEQEQVRNPEIGITKQIKKVRETILDLLKNGSVESLMTNQDRAKDEIHDEVAMLMKDLKELEHQQAVAPDIGVAHKLKNIRTAIENL